MPNVRWTVVRRRLPKGGKENVRVYDMPPGYQPVFVGGAETVFFARGEPVPTPEEEEALAAAQDWAPDDEPNDGITSYDVDNTWGGPD